MSAKPERQRPEAGIFSGKDKAHLIFLSGVALIMALAMFVLPKFMSNETPLPGNAPEVPFSQVEDYSHAVAPKEDPAPGPWTEDPALLEAVRDITPQQLIDLQSRLTQSPDAGETVPFEQEAFFSLLHRARAAGDGIDEEIEAAGNPEFEALTLTAPAMRGRAVRVVGTLETLHPAPTPENNAARVTQIWEGSLIDEENRQVFFKIAGFPQNIYIPDRVVLRGYFMKIHGDVDTMRVAPLIVGDRLALAPPPGYPLAGNDTILQKLVADDDPQAIEKINVPAREYLLHKVRGEDAAAIKNAVDPKIAMQEMIQLPRQVRGKAVRVKGVLLLRPERERVDENGSGLRNVYTGYMGNDSGIYRFTVIEPPLFERGQMVILNGYFLQRMSHIDHRNNRILTPMIIGRALEASPETLPDASDQRPIWIAAVVVFVIILVLFFLMQWDNRSSANFTLELRKQISKPKTDLKESGRRLMAAREESLRKSKEKHDDKHPPTTPPADS